LADTILKTRAYFSELDGVVGDGDFGYSIARGFEKGAAGMGQPGSQPAGNFLKKVPRRLSAQWRVSGTIWAQPSCALAWRWGPNGGHPRGVIAMFRAAIEASRSGAIATWATKNYLDAWRRQ
jgi:hypothetical protein